MVDQRLLLNGLEEYRESLQQHLDSLDEEFAELEIRWKALEAVYGGDAAEQFKGGWARTRARFTEYLERTNEIARMLSERIEDLRDANRPESMI